VSGGTFLLVTGWRPGQRDEERALEEPYADIPRHLGTPLWSWIKEQLNSERLWIIAIHLRLRIPDPTDGWNGLDVSMSELITLVNDQPTLMLDLIEDLLPFTGNTYGAARNLEAVLAIGNSAYAVRSDNAGLEMRVLPEAKLNVEKAIAAADKKGSVGEHLTTAWNAAYGRIPDPAKAYGESIKAVEGAAAPVLSPNNLKATLGTLIGQLKADAGRYQFAISVHDAVGMVVANMQVLWTGQTSRHGGVEETLSETVDAAQAAVHLAATLAQWFQSGAIRRL